jgi:hypothetical protein
MTTVNPQERLGKLSFAAAGKLAMLFRKRYADGYALLEDLESEPSRVETRIVYRDSERMRRTAVFGSVTIRFGKYQGRSLREIPADYLIWALRNLQRLSPSMREAIRGYLAL